MTMMKFPYMYTTVYEPLTGEIHLTEFNNYESNVDVVPIDDREGMRTILREMDLDNFKPSEVIEMFLNFRHKSEVKDSTLTEDELITLIQKLRRDDSGTGKSNIEYMSNYVKPQSREYQAKLDSFRASLMVEKEEEEKEYYSNKNEYDEYNSYYASSSNRFLNEIDELK